ncbi:hypothetical protein L1887_18455 [Cichorium endivia]|nr:hypothetical protein L1887_18455 [Cichorium endivia]
MRNLHQKKLETFINGFCHQYHSFFQFLWLKSTLADLLFSSITTPQALADTNPPRPPQTPLQAELVKQNPSTNSLPFSQSNVLTAPKPQANSDLPEGSQWRYNEFLNAVKKGKVERVRFNKDGGVLQLTAVDGRRASVVVPNDLISSTS